MFLGKSGSSITCKVTGSRRYSSDLPQGGLEVPCTLEFKGNEVNIDKVKGIIDRQKENREGCGNNCVNTKGTEDEVTGGTCTNSIEVQEDSTLVKAEENSKSPGVVCSSISGETIETVLIKDESHSQGAKADEDKSTMKCSFPTSSKYIAIEHNYAKREIQHVWVRFGKSSLTMEERVAINYGKQLNDRHINHAQAIIRSQFGINGLQLTLHQYTRKPAKNDLQIIHSRNNHWITVSTILSMPGCVNVYDSLFDDTDADTSKVIRDLFSNGELQIKMQKVQKQQGSDDCGLFAIAFAVSLARKVDPVRIYFMQSQMRSHLMNCFQEGKFISFPFKSKKC